MKQSYIRNLFIGFFLLLGFQLQAADYYWVGGAGSWTELSHWSTTSGGAPNHSIIPNLNDDVHFDANSGLVNGSIVYLPNTSPAYCRNISWVGVTVTARFLTQGYPLNIYGNAEFAASVLYGTSNSQTAAGIVFTGSSNATFRMNGAARYGVGWYNPIDVAKTGGSLKLLDGVPLALVVPILYLSSGSLDMSGNVHSPGSILGSGSNLKSLDISNATIVMTGNWDYRGSNNTINATGSSISTGTFNSDGLSFPKVDVTGVSASGIAINNTTFGELTFTSPASAANTTRIGAGNTIDRLEYKGGGAIAGSGNTIKDLIIAPSNPGFTFVGNNTITGSLQANTPDCNALSVITGGTAGTITFGAGAIVDVRNVYMSNLTAAGSIALPITVTGADGGGNAGWDFQPRTTGTTLYWVGGAGNWNDKNHWAASSGGTGGYCVPFTGDDVIFNANSGFTTGNNTVTATSGTAWCHNMTWTNVPGAPVLDNRGQNLHIYGSLVLDPTLTLLGAFAFKGTEAGTLTANGFNLGTPVFRFERTGTNGGVTLTDDITHPGFRIFHNYGKLLMPNRTLHVYQISTESSGTRTMDISNSTITLDYEWETNASNNTWVNNGAGSFIIAKSRFITNGLTYPKVQCDATGGNVSIVNATINELLFTDTGLLMNTIALGGNNTIGTLEFKGAAEIRGNNTINNLTLAPSRNYTIRNTQTINGLFSYNNPGCSGLGEMRGVEGTNATLSFGPSSTKDIQNVLLQNMTATGTGVPVAVTGADAGGNSGFNITTSASGARYWVGGSGDWNDAAHWSSTSGGAGGACVPTVSNNVFFNENSFTGGSSVVTISQGNAYCKDMSWTGAGFAPILNKTASLNLEIWGSLIMNPVVTMNARVTFTGPGNATLTPNGSTLGDFDIYALKPGGSKLAFAGDFSNALTRLELRSGGLDLTGRTITMEALSDANVSTPTSLDITNANITAAWSYTGAAKTLQAAGSAITASYFVVNGGTYSQVDVTTSNGAQIVVSGTTISNLLFSNTSPTSTAEIEGNNTIGTLEFKGKGYIGGTGNTIGTLIFFPGKTYTFLGGSNNTITGAWYGSGTPCNPTQITSSTTTNATVTKTSGTVDFDYIRLNRITAAGVTPFKAREHSVDLGGNVNWDIAPYNNTATITGLGPDKILQSSEFPYSINTDGFFASPLAAFSWKKDGVPLSDNSSVLVVGGPGTYSVVVSYPDGCSSSDQIVITRAVADLAVVKTADNMAPAVGSDVVFTLAATNNGPQQSAGVSVTDLLPAGYTYKSAVAPAGTTYDAGTGVWTIGTLASAANATLTITATVNTAGPYANTATITGPEVDPEPANNSSTITPVPVPTADLSVTKTVDQSSPMVGSNVVFTLDVSNAGPSEATGMVLTDVLPSGYTFVSAATPTGTTYDPLTGLWTIGTLANGATATATLTATVNPAGSYSNTASVTLTEDDPETTNNSATVTPVPTPLANLSIVKTVDNSLPYAGDNLIFTLTAANAGPSDATGVQVNDLLPSGYTFVSASPSVGVYNPSTGIWSIGTLANGANATLTVTATVKDAGAFANTATISATETDPVTANNSSTVSPTPVIIKVTKTGPSTVNSGATVSYVVSVKNTGTGNALAAVTNDIVSPDLDNVSWTTAVQGTATVTSGASGTGNNISVTGNIPGGAANQIDVLISGTIPAASPATSISNTANVTAPGGPVINSNTVTTTVGRQVDLHLQKTGPSAVVAGSAVVYTLNVTNTGPSDANNVDIIDNIPTGLNNVTWTAAAQNGATINGPTTGTGSLNMQAYIPAGTASVSVSITGTLDASYAGATLVNTATASPQSGVSDLTPASSTVTTAVSRKANIRIVKSGPANIGTGEAISYVLRVVNDGPSDVTGVEIKDMIPAGVLTSTWTASVQNGATISAPSGTGNIDLTGDIPAGTGQIEILVSGSVDPALSDGDTFSNTATANLPSGSPVTDPDLTSNTSTIPTVVSNTPELRVSKNGPSTVNIGDPITYTIVIANDGGGDVNGASIVDNVPASVTVSSWNIAAAGGAVVTGPSSGNTNSISSTGNIPAAGSATLTLTVQGTVNVNAVPSFTNTVTVTAGGTTSSSVTTAVNQSTDMVVEKNGPQTVIAGRPISYTIKLSNAGPQNAQGLIINDIVPAAVENVSWSAVATGAASINGTFTGSTNTILVNADVAAGAANYVLVTVDGIVNASAAPSTLTNEASVSLPGAITDFDLANNTSEVSTVVSGESNLAITNSVDNIAPDAGSNVVFTLVASNNGPSEGTGIMVTDALPAGYTFVSATPSAGSYDPATGVWSIGGLANGASSTLTITASVNASGPYANTATISGTAADPVTANNTATVTPVPVAVTDLMITKTANDLTPDAGGNIVFTLVATNNGPSAGTGVSATDLLAAGYTFVSATPSAGTYDPSTGVWSIGGLASGASATLTITATVNASGPYANTATISGTENDPDAANNSATVSPTLVPVADLSITKTADNLSPVTGGNIVFTVTATNNGPSAGSGVTVTDLLPAGYTHVSSVASGGTYNPATGTWVIGTLANAGSSTLTITARVNASGPYANTATISGTETDPVPANNSATVTPVPVPVANLAIVKTADELTPDAGGNIVFTIVATNNGPSEATAVVVTDLLPAGYTYLSSTASTGASYIMGTGEWAIGTLANGASATLSITARVNAAGSYANTATISGTETDPAAANNTSTVTPVPVPVTELAIAQTVDHTNPVIGSNVIFSVVATNNGPSNGTGISITDLLLSGYTYVSSTSPAGTSYDPVTGLWTVGSLANGASTTLTITATVNATGLYANSAIISGTQADPVAANNAATVTPVPVPVTDLAISKTADKVSAQVGTDIVFTMVATNNGPSEATGVAVTDLLPAGYTYVSSAAEPGTNYDPLTGIWTIGQLANATSSTLSVTATVNVSGDYSNTATISGAEADPAAANNTVTIFPVIEAVADLSITKTADNLSPKIGGNIVFTLVASNNGPSEATGITVTDPLAAGYSYVSSAAPAGTSYDPLTGVWTVGTLANAASSTLTITARVNAAGPHANTATISGIEIDAVTANNTATVTPVPETLALSITKGIDGAEPGTSGSFMVSLPAGVTVPEDITLNYTVSGTATAGSDYTTITAAVIIPAGQNSVNIPVTVTDDQLIEVAETVTMTLAGGSSSNFTFTGTGSATVTITDDESKPENLILNIVKTADAAEPATNGSFSISLPAGLTAAENVAVNYTISGTATATEDYTPLTGSTVILAGQNGVVIPLTVMDDNVPEVAETLTLTLTGGTSASFSFAASGTSATATANFTDDDKKDQVITFTALPVATLGDPAFSLTATGGASGNPVTYTSSDPSIAIVSGNTLTIVGVGTATITASQAGNAGYHAAADVTQVLTVLPRPNTAPTLATINDQQICYSAAMQTLALSGITTGTESDQTLTLSVSSNNPDLFSALAVTSLSGGNASLNYTINGAAGGTALITVTVKDNGGTANGGTDTFSRTFALVAAPLPQVNIVANPGTSVSKGETIELTASGAVSYSWANASGILSGQNSATLTVRPAQTTTYTVTGTSAAGCVSTQEITITVIEDYNLAANNVLTPNGDGKNDFFVIKNIDMYPNNEVRVFDRAGRSVYSKRGYNNEWDGTINGIPLDEETYYYIIDLGNGVKTKKGFISIVRKY